MARQFSTPDGFLNETAARQYSTPSGFINETSGVSSAVASIAGAATVSAVGSAIAAAAASSSGTAVVAAVGSAIAAAVAVISGVAVVLGVAEQSSGGEEPDEVFGERGRRWQSEFFGRRN